MALLTAVCVVALLALKDYLLAWWQARQVVPVPDAVILAAVRQAAQKIGLDGYGLAWDTDLVASGKVYDLLHHAAIALGKDHELRTVRDLCDWLAAAPTR